MKSHGIGMAGGCLVIFALPFFFAGLFVMHLGLSSAWWYWSSRTWVTAPAVVDSIEIVEGTDSDGDSTYSLKGAYTYTYEGRTYRSSRFRADEGASASPRRIREMYDVLENHRRLGTSIDALVNPHAPDQALIFREISAMMLTLPVFGLTFVMAGLILGSMGWGGVTDAIRVDRRRSLYPDQPWKWEGLWDDFRIKASPLRQVLASLFAVTFFNSFVWTFVILLSVDGDVPELVFWGLLAFGILCLLLYIIPIRAIRQYMHYGTPTLLFEQVPVSPGETLRMVLLLESKLMSGGAVRATIKCDELRVEQSGDETTTVTDNRWSQTRTFAEDIQRRSSRAAIPIVFEIREGLPSRDMFSEPRFQWKLEIKAVGTARSFSTEFEIPVFRCSQPDLIERRAGSETL